MLNLEPCLPPSWAATGHAQTLIGHLLPSPKLRHKGSRLEIPLDDGDRLVGFVQEGGSKTVVYLFHGLAGSSDSPYMHRTSMVAQKLGHTVFLFNHRGCGEGVRLAKGPYHSGRAEDLSAAIETGRKMFPRRRHVAIGFSMSGNALLLLLTGRRGRVKPDAAISVNAPIQLEKCSRLLHQGFNRLYDLKFYRDCRYDVLLSGNELGKKIKWPRVMSIYDFDNLYTAPAGGFADREDYYGSCSAYHHLAAIETPTIMISAKDDPMVPFEDYQTANVSKHIMLHLENIGGHMGYWSGVKSPLGDHRWQDYAIREALMTVGS